MSVLVPPWNSCHVTPGTDFGPGHDLDRLWASAGRSGQVNWFVVVRCVSYFAKKDPRPHSQIGNRRESRNRVF